MTNSNYRFIFCYTISAMEETVKGVPFVRQRGGKARPSFARNPSAENED